MAWNGREYHKGIFLSDVIFLDAPEPLAITAYLKRLGWQGEEETVLSAGRSGLSG